MHVLVRSIFLLSALLIFGRAFSVEQQIFWSNLTWHVQLQGKQVFPDRDVFVVDLFDTDTKVIKQLKKRWVRVICYFSAGTHENWRSDAWDFPWDTIGNPLLAWTGENWIDIRNAAVRNIMKKRIILARTHWCDGVDPDNVNGHENDTGFSLTKQDLLRYNRFLIREAHTQGLMIGLKNTQSLIPYIGKKYDFFINESCYTFSECSAYSRLVHSKPVLIMEYGALNTTYCQDAKKYGFTLQFFSRELDALSLECPELFNNSK